MKRMILASSSSDLPWRRMRKLIETETGKKTKEIRVLAIISPGTKTGRITYGRKIRSTLKKIGVKRSNITVIDIATNIKAGKFRQEDFDLFWSSGGNTFKILDRIRKTGFDEWIKKYVKEGRLYIGFSAGSILPFKTISVAGWGSSADQNEIKLRDLRGLDLCDTAVIPHYTDDLKQEWKDFERRYRFKVKLVRDGEAWMVLGKKQYLMR